MGMGGSTGSSRSTGGNSGSGDVLLRHLPAVPLLRRAVKKSSGSDEAPPLPVPASFLYAGEFVVLHGAVAKQGPSMLSLFKPRRLVLTSRRLLYFSSKPTDKRGVIVLTPDAVAGVTHQGKRFELSAFPAGEPTRRRYYFECVDGAEEPSAQR